MTVELNPVEWGRLGVDVLATYLKGDKVEPRVFIKHIIIDSANIDEAAEDVMPNWFMPRRATGRACTRSSRREKQCVLDARVRGMTAGALEEEAEDG